MIQEFFKTTVVSKYIKYLLANTPIPQYPFINEGEVMVEGCFYTYKNNIIKCTKTGSLSLTSNNVVFDYLNASNDLKVQDVSPYDIVPSSIKQLYPGWMAIISDNTDIIPLSVTDDYVGITYNYPAEFKIVNTFTPNQYKPGVTQTYESNTSYYDVETHRRLGDYLRYLKNMYSIDLMCLYNCFSYKVSQDIFLQMNEDISKTAINKHTDKTKVILVPIKFNKPYTICLDSDVPVQMRAVLFNNSLIEGKLNEDIIVHNSMQFTQPVLYTCENIDANAHRYEKYLYLAIQVSNSNTSSVSVIEGDYSHNKSRVVSDIKVLDEGTTDVLSSIMCANLTLLKQNDNMQHPFSDKLIQYLVRNTIDDREFISENVSDVINSIGNFDYGYEGQWSTHLRYELYNRYFDTNNRDDLVYEDILGYVDNDVENAIRKGYLKV